jgi:O-antigen ligase
MTFSPASGPAAPVSLPPLQGRAGVAHWIATVGLFCMPALVLTLPQNLLPYGILLLLSTLLAPDYLWRARGMAGRPVVVLSWMVMATVGFALISIHLFDQGLRDIDVRSRFVVIPWIALWVCALRPDMRWLWTGALAGLIGTMVLSILQVAGGAARAELTTNAIVLADIVLVLMVLLVFCRPHQRWTWVIAGMVAGCVTIVLSGSRGVWLALLALLVVMAMSLRWRTGPARLGVLLALVAIAGTLTLTIPSLREQVRLTELKHDVVRMERGDSDSSAGARVERLQVAYETFLDHPLTGVGIGHFDSAMQRLPVCRDDPAEQRCHLGHAHNDLAEWAATQGAPGLLLLLAIYGVPLWVFIGLHRRSGEQTFRGPAAAGIMVVVTYVLCGITQSMFAHQITASFYVTIVGLLAGLSIVQGHTRRLALARARAQPPR